MTLNLRSPENACLNKEITPENGRAWTHLKTPSSHLCFTGFIGFWWQKNFLIHIQEVFAFYHFTPSVYFRVSYLYLWKSTNHCVIITLFNIILKCLFELSLLSAWPLHFFIKPTAASTYILNKSTDITIGKKKRNGKEFFEYAPIFVSSQCIYIIYTFQWRETIGHSIHWHSYLLLTLKSSWIKSLKYLRKDWS